jgi:hypothetical protein
MGTHRGATGTTNRALWLSAFLVTYVMLAGAVMITNTAVLGLGDPKFGAWGWMLYWPIWGAVYFVPIAVAGFTAERWWPSTPRRLLRFLGATLAIVLVAMEVSFLLDIGLEALVIELAILSVAVFIYARMYLRNDG